MVLEVGEREKRDRERDGAWSITGQRVADALRRRQGEYLHYLGLGYIRDVYTHSCGCACVRGCVCVCVHIFHQGKSASYQSYQTAEPLEAAFRMR